MKALFKLLAVLVAFGVALGLVAFVRSGKPEAPNYDYVLAEKRDVSEVVTVTGRVVPAEQVDLAFEEAGKVKEVFFKVGDRVDTGDIIVQLTDADILAQLAQAEAGMRAERAKLVELERGLRPEEVQVQAVKVKNAVSAVEQAKQGLLDTLQDSYAKSDDAVRGKMDSLFVNPRGENPMLSFTTEESGLQSKVQDGRKSLEDAFGSWQTSVQVLKTSDDLKALVPQTRARLDDVSDFLNNISVILTGLTPVKSALSQATIVDYQTRAGAARSSVNSAVANLSAAEENLNAAESALLLDRQELALKEAGTVSEQIEAQGAKLEAAEAKVEELKAALLKRQMTAPFKSVVTKRDIEPGEIVSPGKNVISLISDDTLMLEAFVPEADIAKVELRDTARLSLDAYAADDFFEARVIFIDPAETVIEGVATYKVKLEFLRRDGRVKPGMTADLDIIGSVSKDVLALPQRLIIRAGDGYAVKVVTEDGTIAEVPVKIGLRGSDGFVEITEGLSAGAKVVTSARN